MTNTYDLSQQYGGTEFTAAEVLLLGEAVLNWINATATLGHASPGNTLDYVPLSRCNLIGEQVLRDFVAWTSGRTDLAPGCDERLRELIRDSGWSELAGRRFEQVAA